MITKSISGAYRRESRLRIDRSAALVVLLLALLFALAITAAVSHHPLVDLDRAALQGGL